MQTAWWLLNAARGLSLSSFDSLVNTGHDMKFNLRLSICNSVNESRAFNHGFRQRLQLGSFRCNKCPKCKKMV